MRRSSGGRAGNRADARRPSAGHPSDLRQEPVGSVNVTYAAETIGASLAPIERDQLARYRPRVAVVQLDEGRPW